MSKTCRETQAYGTPDTQFVEEGSLLYGWHGILLDTLIQADALGGGTYIVVQWKREDEQQARQQLESLTYLVTESQHALALAVALDRLVTSLDHIKNRFTCLEDVATQSQPQDINQRTLST